MRLVLLVLLAGCSRAPAGRPAVAPALPHAAPGQLVEPAAFSAIADRAVRSRALFGEIARVLTHPRCVNCHTPDESPRQGDAHAMHEPPVARGAGDRGVPAMQCVGCHQDHNLELARVPGAPGWHLAPTSMVWLDRTPSQICAQIKDPARNGGRTLAQLQEHAAHDPLVGWGWTPGADRAAVPGTQARFGELVAAWIASGAQCPTQEAAR